MSFLIILAATALISTGAKISIRLTWEYSSFLDTKMFSLDLGWLIGVPMMAWGVWLILGEARA